MLEQIQQLETRVDALAKLLESARQKNEQLRRENGQLNQQVETLTQFKTQNAELENQIQRLESDLEAKSQKETQVRDRVLTILERIDTIEHEMGPSGAAGAE